jgi:asparagine synthase (glutamine-hydrolysing)
MHSPSGALSIVFNGEIFNYQQISDRLAGEGWSSSGDSDTEVLLSAIERWGMRRALDVVDGQFAFAVYDHRRARLSLVRDRFGEKPLSYAIHDGVLYFSSDLRAFEAVPSLDLALDVDATAAYFRFGHVPGTATIFGSVSRLAPATWIEFDLDGIQPQQEHRYWSIQTRENGVHARSEEQHERLADILSGSVRNRLVSDRPIGAFLSGGIDSSLVCALAAQHTSGALKTFTMGWDHAEFDESTQAGHVASAIGADHHDVRLSRGEVVAAVDRLGDVMDEPFADSSSLAVLLVATAARRDVVVALSGDGGDELFAGYNRHRWLLSSRSIRSRVPEGSRRRLAAMANSTAPAIEALLRPIPLSRRPRLIADKVRKLGGALAAASMAESYQGLIATDPSVGQFKSLPPVVERGLLSDDPDDLLWALRVADIIGYMCDDVLTKVDRATMAVSLESRTPFLNRELAELALKMDSSMLIGRSGGKHPLRQMLGQLLPSVRFTQPKMGFGVPIADLLRHELRDRLAQAAATFSARRAPVAIDWESACRRLDLGDDSPAAGLWSLLMFEMWASRRSRAITWARLPAAEDHPV